MVKLSAIAHFVFTERLMQSPYRKSAGPDYLPYPAFYVVACVPPEHGDDAGTDFGFCHLHLPLRNFCRICRASSEAGPGRNWCCSCLAGRHLVYAADFALNRSTSQIRIAPAKPLGVGEARRSLSMAATSALTASPVSSEAAFNISQNKGSRLIEV